MRHFFKPYLFGLLAIFCATAWSASAAELLMFREDGCGWCARWDAEIGPIYPKTAEGKRVPLRRLDLSDGVPENIKTKRAVHFTPTFVMVENGQEIGRIAGYPGEDAFWWLLEELVGKLPAEKTTEKEG
jgi:thioredoxin-related protein